MKILLLSFLFLLSALGQPKETSKASAPSIWGQVVKTKKETYGHQYFVYFKENGQDFAYPLSSESQVGKKRLESMVGKYAKIYGKAELEQAKVGESQFIMAFQVKKIDPLTLKDLNENMSIYHDRLDVDRLEPRPGKRVSEQYTKGIDDKTANTAIMVGGAALAVEVLANILAGPK